MRRFGRPPISIMGAKYPVLVPFCNDLKDWCRDKSSLVEAAREMCCTYRELSNYRHGQRWPPDRILQHFGYDPQELRVKQRAFARFGKLKNKSKQAQRVIKAAVELALSVQKPRKHDCEYLTEVFFETVTDYIRADRSRSV